MPVPLFDTQTPLRPLRRRDSSKLIEVLQRGAFVLGPEVAAFEQEFAAYLGVRHVIGVANGTDAITIALRALGVRPGDDVVVPSFTFYACAEAIVNAGARPVFCDIDPATRNVTGDDRRGGADAGGQGDRRGRSVRLPCADRRAARARAAGARGRGAGGRRDARRRAARARSAMPPRSPSTPPRISARSAMAVRSPPTTTRSPSSRGRCASTARATSERSTMSATTRGSTRSRRRSCGCCCRTWTVGATAAARSRLPTPSAGSDDHLGCPSVPVGADPAWHLYVVTHPRADALLAGLSERGIEARGYYRDADPPPAGDGAVSRATRPALPVTERAGARRTSRCRSARAESSALTR